MNRALAIQRQGFFITSSLMTLIISLGSILFAFVWAVGIKRPLTQRINVFLAFVSLLQFDTFIGLSTYSFYAITFASILAGIEPGNSLNLKPYQKNFFLATSFIFILFTLEDILNFPFTINRAYFGGLYLLIAGIVVLKGFKRVRSRVGVMVIWSGFAVNWLLTILF